MEDYIPYQIPEREIICRKISQELKLNNLEFYNEKEKEFVIHVFKKDIIYVNKNYRIIMDDPVKKKDCFVISTSYSPDHLMIECINKLFEINTHDKGKALISACRNNTNLGCIKYLIENLNMGVIPADNINPWSKCLLTACKNNTNLHIIKYLIQDLKINTNSTNTKGQNCLILACSHNSNLDIIKYLIEDVQMDIYYTDPLSNNCLISACKYNTNLDIIKYLIEGIHMDINFTNLLSYKCLMAGCSNNTNLDIIKYLIEDIKMNIDNMNYLKVACESNENYQVIKYLFEHSDAKIIKRMNVLYLVNNQNISIHAISISRCMIYLSLCIGNYELFNEIILKNIQSLGTPKVNNIISEKINYLMLNKKNRKHLGIDPFKQSYKTDVRTRNRNKEKSKINYFNYKNQSELLFKHNGNNYYGNQRLVYSSMNIMKDIDQCGIVINDNNCIELTSQVSDNLMNLYVHTSHVQIFDINNISPDELLDFLNLIDKYPTDILSIDKLEIDICDFMIKHKIVPCQGIINLTHRYQLKYMYLYIHQINFNN